MGPDFGSGADNAAVDCCVGVDDGFRMDRVGMGIPEFLMDGPVCLRGSDITPVALIEHDGSELLSLDEFDKGRHNRDDFTFWNEIENPGVDAVDAGELVSSWGGREQVAHIGHLFTGDVDVAVVP